MSNAPIRSSRRIPRAPSRLVAEAGADVVHVAPVVATEADVGAPVANTPPSSPVVVADADAARAPGGSTPPACRQSHRRARPIFTSLNACPNA